MEKLRAPVNKIIPFSQVDGPGNRSAVFFQQCGFRCKYCHNPETINMCVHCGVCAAVCPVNALTTDKQRIIWERERCCGCDACIAICPHMSSPKIAWMSTDDILNEIKASIPFIRGITTSGGECTIRYEFLIELFNKIHALGKTAYIDTNGQTKLWNLPEFTESFDQAMLDVKSADEREHIILTGCSKDTVFSNLEYLLEKNKLFEVRTVVVPELLDNDRTVRAVSRIIGKYPQVRYKLIRFRNWGVKGELSNMQSPDQQCMDRLAETARSYGVSDIVII